MRLDRFGPPARVTTEGRSTSLDKNRLQNKPPKESNRRRRRSHKRRVPASPSGGIFTSSSEEVEQDRESGNSSRSSNFSVKSYPRTKKRSGDMASRHLANASGGQGYMSDMPKNVMHTMRSELRRDMQMMMNNMMSQQQNSMHQSLHMPQDQHNSHYGMNTYPHIQPSPGYQTVPITPQQLGHVPQVQVQAQSSNSNYVLPFIAGCAVSCIGLSYMGLLLYAVLRP